jgi:UDP-N-acetylglucosamine 2-epimerase (non-hydrolysing)
LIRVSIVFGTRPEVIKLAPVIKLMEQEKNIQLNVCFTGQHKEMALPLFDFFDLKINSSLDIMQPNQTLTALSARTMTTVDEYFKTSKPQIVFVQGDTTTAMSVAMAAFYQNIKIGHVEAGLRTYNIRSPFPEEFNRQIISKIADLHFASTGSAKNNLDKENVEASKIFVTGNTVIDALLFARNKLQKTPSTYFQQYSWYNSDRKLILITGHRRESFGAGFENICMAIQALAKKYPECNFIYPVHLNPNVQEPVMRMLQGLPNVHLLPPINYMDFTSLLERSYLILTDSGGIQEEAPTLGKPVLVMRNDTERMEAVIAGASKLVGTEKETIINNVSDLIENKELYAKMSNVINPFGDGKAAQRIVKHTLDHFR